MDRPVLDEHFVPIQARYCRVKVAALIFLLLLFFMFLLMKYVSPLFFILLPAVMILGMALLLSSPLTFLRKVILRIDEHGIYDMRTMTRPVAWQEVTSVTEKVTYLNYEIEAFAGHSFFVETVNKHFSRPGFERTLREVLRTESDKGFTVSVFLLELSQDGLRDAFSQAHRLGYLPTWQTTKSVLYH